MHNCPKCGGYVVQYDPSAAPTAAFTCPKCTPAARPDFQVHAAEWLLRYEGHVVLGRTEALAQLLEAFYELGVKAPLS